MHVGLGNARIRHREVRLGLGEADLGRGNRIDRIGRSILARGDPEERLHRDGDCGLGEASLRREIGADLGSEGNPLPQNADTGLGPLRRGNLP